MKNYFVFIIAIVSIIVMEGCSNKTSTEYPHVLIFNNTQYFLTLEKVQQDKIGKQVGVVNREVDSMPKKNEESNFTGDSRLFEIKGVDPNKVIAVEIEGEYQKAKKHLNE